MSSLSRLVQIGYVFGWSFVLVLLLGPSLSQAQFGVSSGYRATPGLPTIAVPVFSGSASASGAVGGILGGGGSSGSASASFSTQIIYINLGSFFPNNGQLVGLPMPTLTPMLNNWLTDSTGAPWALMGVMSMGGGGMGLMGG